MQRSRRLLSWILFASAVWVASPLFGGDWPRWRGPAGDGTSPETGLPVRWSETEGVRWKCPLPEWGNNTPVIHGEAVFLTSHVDDQRLVLLRIEKSTGRIVWTRQVGTGSTARLPQLSKTPEERRHQAFHESHNLASPSAVTDGEVVVAHFGNGELAAYDYAGNLLWLRDMQKDYGEYTIWWGHANSPVLFGDLVISACMQDACRDLPGEPSPSYVVAHDKRTGREIWKTPRVTEAAGEFGDSYTTPVFRQRDGQTEMILMGGEILDAYDPATGRRLWHLPRLVGNRPVTGPVAWEDLIITTQGRCGPLVAFRPGGPGERSHDEIVWKDTRGTPDTPWPVVCKGLLFVVNDDGIAKCLDPRTGQVKWRERLGGSPYRASPLAAEGRVYFLGSKGLATVVEAADTFRVLAKNQLDDETLASPAASDGRLFIRGRKSLYCLGEVK